MSLSFYRVYQLSLDGVEATIEEQVRHVESLSNLFYFAVQDSVDGQLTDGGINKDNTVDSQQSLLVSVQHHRKKSPTSSKKVGRGNVYYCTLMLISV